MSASQDAFVRRLAYALEVSGLSQRAIAARLNVAPQSISTWLRKGTIHRKHIAPLCDVCRVDVVWLLTGDGEARRDERPLPDAATLAEELVDRLGLADQAAIARRLLTSIQQRLE